MHILQWHLFDTAKNAPLALQHLQLPTDTATDQRKSSPSLNGPRLALRMHPSETTLTLKYHEALPCQQQWHRHTKNVMTIHGKS